jgi:hypothetical protein
VFPGLMYRPRAVGSGSGSGCRLGSQTQGDGGGGSRSGSRSARQRNNTWGHAMAAGASGKAAAVAYETSQGTGISPENGRATGSYNTTGSSCIPGNRGAATAAHTNSRTIPPLYRHVTVQDRPAVQLRLPGLYAAEWVADHQMLHAAGRCRCRASFAPVVAAVDEGDLAPDERAVVNEWRRLESLPAVGDGHEVRSRRAAIMGIESGPASERGREDRAAAVSNSQGGPVYASSQMPAPDSGAQTQVPMPSPDPWSTMLDTSPTIPMLSGTTDLFHDDTVDLSAGAPGDTADAATCGFPIGAGPEGVAHSSGFSTCSLSRPMLRRQKSSPF